MSEETSEHAVCSKIKDGEGECETKAAGEADSADNRKEERSQSSNGTGQSLNVDPANLHYEGNLCIYTDPETKFQYQWDDSLQQWLPRNNAEHGPAPNAPAGDKNYVFDGESYTYKDAASGIMYKWDSTKSVWYVPTSSDRKERPKCAKKPQGKEDDIEEYDTDEEDEKAKSEIRQDMTSGHYDHDGENRTYTDPKDGTVYFWDRDRNAWFPKVDDDFMAQYQMNYGFVDNQGQSADSKSKEEDDRPDQTSADLKRKPQEPQWFDLDQRSNTKVYVSNLPLDTTEQEFVDIMQKYGLVMKDMDTGKMKVKLYHEPDNPKQLKGDGLCTYIKRESVDLALKLLDGSDLRGYKIKVESAKFELKGTYDPSLKPKKRRRKDKEKMKKAQEKLFDWRPDKLRGERSKHEKTVIIKNLFDPQCFDTDVGLILEYQQDLREEGSKCGTVKKVVIYDRHAEGVAQITFREPEEADACVLLFNNRWFNKRQIVAETWDGKTKYRIAETAEETEARLAKWTKFLESEEGKRSGLVENHNAGLEGASLNEDSDEDDLGSLQVKEVKSGADLVESDHSLKSDVAANGDDSTIASSVSHSTCDKIPEPIEESSESG